jgi:hypothetical protein
VTVPCGGDAERDRQVGLASARRAEQHDVAGLGQERSRSQRPDLAAAGGLGVEVEVLQVLRAGKPAARMRSSAPDALRAGTSRSSTAAR